MKFARTIPLFIGITLLSYLGAFNIVSEADARLPAIVNGQALPSLADMLERVTPSVVNISTETGAASPKDPVFQHYFGKKSPSTKRIGTGSGIIVDAENGYIVTNAHVIGGAKTIVVTLKDKRQFYAKLVGKDLKADVAVIRIQPDRLTAMRIANSKHLRVGDFVVAIGNPYGLGQSVTSGIISALGRTGLGVEQYEDFIQTDAPINPGNSGGALVNLRGELVGINTAILGGRNGGNIGIGFAIPSSMIINIKDQLVEKGRVERGQLGVRIEDLKPSMIKSYKLTNGQGVLISDVIINSPADKAGIKKGDVITRINGAVVTNSSNLKSMIGNLRMGSRVNMEYMRNGFIKQSVAKIGFATQKSVLSVNNSRVQPVINKPKKKEYYKDPWD